MISEEREEALLIQETKLHLLSRVVKDQKGEAVMTVGSLWLTKLTV